jgi:hypothetical protein
MSGPGGTNSAGSNAGSGGSSAGGTASGGNAGAAMGGNAGATTGGSAGAATGGNGGAANGGNAGSTAGGGTAGAGGNGGGGAGGAANMPGAVATIAGLNGQTVTGTATFTQGATMTKLVLNLTACPNGAHSSHLHAMKDCGNNGTAAGGHWAPNGEMLGDYTCANNAVTYEVSKPVAVWTVGDGSATDVTKYAFMVHETTDAQGSGARIGCRLITKQ